MPNMLLVGDTNNGKTMLVLRFRAQHPVLTTILKVRACVCLCLCLSSRHRLLPTKGASTTPSWNCYSRRTNQTIVSTRSKLKRPKRR
jgi:hypothetical protein